MTQPQAPDSVRTIVEAAIPTRAIDSISTVSAQRLTRAFEVQLIDGQILLLNLSPSSPRQLRSERWPIQSEALVVQWLAKGSSQQSTKDGRLVARSVHSESPTRQSRAKVQSRGGQLPTCLPVLIKHSAASSRHGSVYSLFKKPPGSPIIALARRLTRHERSSIEFQKGCLMRQLVGHVSPNRRFGLAITVLGHMSSMQDVLETARKDGMESDSWRKTFHSLLEGILRDGEDVAVTVSYERIRAAFHNFAHLLDAVTVPRLVVVHAADDGFVLVARPRDDMAINVKKEVLESETRFKAEPLDPSDDERLVLAASPRREPGLEGEGPRSDIKIKPEPLDDTHHDPDIPEPGQSSGDPDEAIRLTGLSDWSSCIFGDPLFAPVFSHASPEFERGFHGRLSPEQAYSDLIQDQDNAPIRLLLYECYHSAVALVDQFFHPTADSSEREIAARRRLAAVLTRLEKASTDGGEGLAANKRARRPSREDWPMKKPRDDTPVKD